MELSQGGNQLVDDTGASYSLFFSFITGDRLFPGGHWVKVDATHVRSIGGLVHEFYGTGKLKAIYWQSADHPRLAYRTSQPFGGGVHTAWSSASARRSASSSIRSSETFSPR